LHEKVGRDAGVVALTGHDARMNRPLARRTNMPAKSQSQQRAAGAALAAKRGQTKVRSLKPASKSMYDSMSEKQLEDFAHTKTRGKPRHKHDA
jgi:hypothetical protein